MAEARKIIVDKDIPIPPPRQGNDSTAGDTSAKDPVIDVAVDKFGEDVRKKMRDQKFCPIVEMITIAKNKKASLVLKAKIACDLARYAYPQAKSVDMASKAAKGVTLVIKQFGSLPKTEVSTSAPAKPEPSSIDLSKEDEDEFLNEELNEENL